MRREFHVRFCEGLGVRFPRATRLVIGLQRPEDAEYMRTLLGQRLATFGLELHPDKSGLVDFRRPPADHQVGKGPGSFDLLGFTHYWSRSRRGRWHMATKTSRSRLRRTISSVYDWCRRHRHQTIKAQHEVLRRKLTGHYNYFNVQGNTRAVGRVAHYARRAWYKWLRCRSQRSRLTWDRFNDLLRDFPLPVPRVTKSLWATP